MDVGVYAADKWQRGRITAIMNTDPARNWAGRDLARQLQVKPRNMLTQLAERARLGFLTRTGKVPTHPTRRPPEPGKDCSAGSSKSTLTARVAVSMATVTGTW